MNMQSKQTRQVIVFAVLTTLVILSSVMIVCAATATFAAANISQSMTVERLERAPVPMATADRVWLTQPAEPLAVTWTQTDWSAGPGQPAWYDARRYDASNGVHVYTAGEVTLGFTAPAGDALVNLDQDGIPDLIIGKNRYGPASLVCHGGVFGFSLQRCQSLPVRGTSAIWGDLNNDGFHDVVLTADVEGLLAIYYGSTSGYSDSNRTVISGNHPWQVAAGDVDNDDDLDLIVADDYANVRVYWNIAGAFSLWDVTVISEERPGSPNLADVNKDGYLDLLVFAISQDTPVARIYWGGSSGYSTSNRLTLTPDQPSTPRVADFNHDGYFDIIYGTTNPSGSSAIYWGSATGYTSTYSTTVPTGRATSISVADLNADSWEDLLVANHETAVTIVWGSPSGFSMSNVTDLPQEKAAQSVVADFNRDGYPDVVTGGWENPPMHVYWGSAGGYSPSNRQELAWGIEASFAAVGSPYYSALASAGTTYGRPITGTLTIPDALRIPSILAPTGVIASSVYDQLSVAGWNSLSFTVTIPTGTTVQVEVDTSNNGATWSGWRTVGATGASGMHTVDLIVAGVLPSRYLRYRVTMTSSADHSSGPTLHEISISGAGAPSTATPTPTPIPSYNDEFDESTLNPRWTWIETSGLVIYDQTSRPGYLHVSLPGSYTSGFDFPDPPRVMQRITGDFTVSTKVEIGGDNYFRSVGLLLWLNADNYIVLRHSSTWHYLEFGKMQNATFGQVATLAWPDGGPFFLRLQRSGTQIIASYSSNGVTWSQLAATSTTLPGTIDLGLVMTYTHWSTSSFEVYFDWFHVDQPTPTATPTASATPTITPTPSATPTPTAAPTITPTSPPTPTASPTATATACPTCKVDLVINPPTTTIGVGQAFTLTLQVEAGTQLVDGAAAYVDFDPTRFQVQAITPDTARLPITLQNSYNNTLGQIDYSAGAFSNYPSGTFAIARVRLVALAAAENSPFTFGTSQPRVSNTTYAGGSVLRYLRGGTVTAVPVELAILPVAQTIGVGQIFSVTVQMSTGQQPVDMVAAYLDFDPAKLRVTSSTPGATLPTVTTNSYDNNAGTIDYVASTASGTVQGTFTIATIYFEALDYTISTNLTFHTVNPRRSDARLAGASVLGSTHNGAITVRANLSVQPPAGTIGVGEVFTMTLQVKAGSQSVDGAAAYLDFDAAVLQVQAIVPDASRLPITLQNSYNNTLGQVNYAAGALSNFPSGTFAIASVRMVAIVEAPTTALTFHTVTPRASDVTYGGSILGSLTGASRIVLAGTIEGHLTLQRPNPAPHPSWSVPIAFSLYVAGQPNPAMQATPTTNQSGVFNLTLGAPPGSYDACIKNRHTLQSKVPVSLTWGNNVLNLGTLKEGDADNNNVVSILDFSILATTFGKCVGAGGYDDRPDFNEDDCVTILDFSSLASNFGQMGATCDGGTTRGKKPVDEPAVDRTWRPGRARTGTVDVSLLPASSTVATGDVFTLTIQITAGAQPIDGASTYVNFDPAYLQVQAIIPDTTYLPITLVNSYDNIAGTVDYAAGTFFNFPSGTFALAQIRLVVIATPPDVGTDLTFATVDPRKTDITYGGLSVLGNMAGATAVHSQLPTPTPTAAPGICPDYNPPPGIGVEDIQAIVAHWGETSASPGWDARFDLDTDGKVTAADIVRVAALWGTTC